jgi:hypothetical protein
MYLSIVHIKLSQTIDRAEVAKAFPKTAARYHDVPGLLRKYYTIGIDEHMTGGVFVWESLADAKAGHADPAWRNIIKDKYGVEAQITYLEVPTFVDNEVPTIINNTVFTKNYVRT